VRSPGYANTAATWLRSHGPSYQACCSRPGFRQLGAEGMAKIVKAALDPAAALTVSQEVFRDVNGLGAVNGLFGV
jgi:hypothetical protein